MMEENILDSTIDGLALYKTRTEQIFEKERIKDVFMRCVFGLLMGISDGIPGYSGATTLTIFGFYDKFISHAKRFVTVTKIRKSMKSLLWLFPFGIFWLIAALLFARFVTWFSSQGFSSYTGEFTNKPFNGQLILFIIFASISLFSLPTFFYFHRQVLFLKSVKEYKKPKNILLPILFIIGFIIMINIGVFIHLNTTTIVAGHHYKGFLITNDGATHFPKSLYGKLFYVGFLSGFLLFLPGISSSLIMLLCDMYSYVYTIIHDHPLLNIVPLSITFISVIAGMVVNIFITSYLLKKFPKYFYNFSAGIITGAFITILLSASPSLYQHANGYANIVFITVVILVSLIINAYIFLYLYRKNKIEKITFGKYTI